MEHSLAGQAGAQTVRLQMMISGELQRWLTEQAEELGETPTACARRILMRVMRRSKGVTNAA